MSRRAEPLAPEDRRRAIVEAITPLLIDRGQAVTTREMAEAAGVAEGTIFKVFPDKSSVIHEAVRASIDPEPVIRQLGQIYPEAPLEIQLAEAARILVEQMDRVLALFSTVRTLHPPGEAHPTSPPSFVTEANAAINRALTGLFDRHRDRLRIEPEKAAAAFRGLIVGTGHPAMGFSQRLAINEVVEILLTGIIVPAETRVG